MKEIEKFAIGKDYSGFKMTKTIQNRLIPVGKTRDMIDKYGIIESDKKREIDAEKVKSMADKIHREFIDEVLKKTEINWNELYDSYSAKVNKDEYERVQEKYRKEICNKFKNEEKFKKLFKKEIYTELIREEYDEEEYENVEKFKGFFTYFEDFNRKREYIYDDEKKGNKVAYRIVNENFEIFAENRKIMEKAVQGNEILSKKNVFSKMNEISQKLIYPLDEEAIKNYNLLISGRYEEGKCIEKGINQEIKEFNSVNERSIPLLKKLYGNILSEKEPLFKVEKYNDTDELIDDIRNLNELVRNFNREFSKIDLMKMNLSEVFIKWKDVSFISNVVFGDFSIYRKAVLSVREEKPEWISLEEINDCFYLYAENVGMDFEDRKDIKSYLGKIIIEGKSEKLYERLDFTEIKNIVLDKKGGIKLKEYIQSVLDFYNMIRIFERPEDLCLKTEGELYTLLEEWIPKISIIVKIYNKARNLITKKYSEMKELKLNFDCSTFLNGWDMDKENSNLGMLFHDEEENKYYLGIINKKKCVKFEVNRKENSSLKKINMKHIPGPYKMLPKIFLSRKGIEEFKPDEEIIEKYKKGCYKKGENFDIDFCHNLIDYFKDCLSKRYKIFKFNFTETEKYNDISEFYREVEEQGYSTELIGIDGEALLKEVEKENIFLFEITNRHISGRSKGIDVHTELFRKIFENGNDYIQICSAKIFFRQKVIEKKVTHRKGEYLVNKMTKSGRTLKSDEYFEIVRYLNEGIEADEGVRLLLESGEVIFKKADRDLIKDRRYSEEHFTLHMPVTVNPKGKGVSLKEMNVIVNEGLKKGNINILAVNRGEGNLITAVLIDSKGKIMQRKNFNMIQSGNMKVDYLDKLKKKEIERMKSRLNWQDIDSIRNIKEGYLGNVVSEISKMMIENNAVLVMEDLSKEFKHSRAMIERNIYEKFESRMIDKLSCLFFKRVDENERGGLLHPYQLCPPQGKYNSNYSQFGWIFFINAGYISRIVDEEGYINIFCFTGLESFGKIKSFLMKFDVIKMNGNEMILEYRRELFNEKFKGKGVLKCGGKWNVWNSEEKKYNEVDVNECLGKAMEMMDMNEKNVNLIERISKLKQNMITVSAMKLIIECIRICAEKKNRKENDYEYGGLNWDERGAYNLGLKLIAMNEKNEGGMIRNIKTDEVIKFIERRNEVKTANL